MDKSPEAFRTISEVAEVLETPAHVLRFWESRFPQIRPVKRAGGRRYYRPSDVALLSGIRQLLHDQGMTIRGVQKVLREQGVRHVAALAGGLAPPEEDDAAFAATLQAARAQTAPPESAEIVDLAIQPRPAQGAEAEGPGEVLRLYPTATQAPAPARPDTRTPAPPVPERERAQAAAPDPEVPEAGHVFVEDEPQLDLPFSLKGDAKEIVQPRRPPSLAARPRPQEPADRGMFDDIFVPESTADLDVPPKLSGLAARIRALPRPLSPEALLELTDLHSRLGLLHAQIAEALRGRR